MLPDDFPVYALLMLAALVAGAINSIAGGGTLLTFPALTAHVSEVIANGTSTAALVPGSIGGAWGFIRELGATRRWAFLLIGPSLVGGLIGTLLVTQLPNRVFAALVPWLILTAAILFALQPLLMHLHGPRSGQPANGFWPITGIVGFQFLVAIYGGYFGAGIGILMLSAFGILGLTDIHQMNALKAILGIAINGMSLLVFTLTGMIEWRYALPMALAAIIGGYVGARTARRVPRVVIRWLVVCIGFGLAGYYFAKQMGVAV